MCHQRAMCHRREEIGIADLIDRLRERGWRMTAQRRVVAEVLVGDHVHLTAEAVHGLAQGLLPEISLATVYNALNEMVAMGEVAQVAAGDGPKRYDPNVTTAHQHLVCTRCGALRDVVPAGQEQLKLPESQRYGYRLVDIEVVFRGVCPACGPA
ncbi:MAG: Fur family transcriptional regulator [Candidatus Dormibacteria bacterium]